MDLRDVPLREMPGLATLEQPRPLDLAQDGAHAHRRFDIAALADMVDGMLLVADQGDAPVGADGLRLCGNGLLHVAGTAQGQGAGRDGVEDHAHVLGRAFPLVLALQNGPDDVTGAVARQPEGLVQRVGHQVGRAVVLGREGGLVGRVDDRPRPVAFVEAQPRHVLAQQFRVPAQGRVVGQAFEEEGRVAQGPGFLAHSLVQGRAHAAPAVAQADREVVQVAEAQIREMAQQGEPLHHAPLPLGHEDDGPIPLAQRVLEGGGQALHLLGRDERKALGQNGLHLLDALGVDGHGGVVDGADTEHGGPLRLRLLLLGVLQESG
jgi:hypothetical protein